MNDTRTFHGEITAKKLANALVARFNTGSLDAQARHKGGQYVVQIASKKNVRSGGQTALGLVIQENEHGVTVKLGEQNWLGIAASFGQTALSVFSNPMNIINRLDDIAQDIENLTLDDKIWDVVEEVAITVGASHQLSERLRSTACLYCDTANPVGHDRCVACGAPLGDAHPDTCKHCGYVSSQGARACENCGKDL